MYQCPQNHPSDTADYCSVCGVEMTSSAGETVKAPARVPAPPPAGGGEPCPACGAPRDGSAQVFCEACGHRFGDAATPRRPVAPTPAPPPASPPVSPVVRWDVHISVDAANPEAPAGQPPQIFTLFDRENLVGRAGTEVRVQVPIRGDAGVSRRHVLLLRRSEGGVLVRDLGSANGTLLNGQEVPPGVDTPLNDGDTLALGAWTRLTLHAVRS